MSAFGGYPLLIATVAIAALLSGCGQSKRPALSQRPATMDVSIVVTVEYFDPEESPNVEDVPIMAEAPGSEPPPVGPEARVADEIPVNAELPHAAGGPAIKETAVAASIPLNTATPANEGVPPAAEIRVAARTLAALRILAAADRPDFGERNRAFFVFNSAAVQDDQLAMINEWGDWLKAHPGWALRIEGHTDRQGPCLYNRWLGQQRANAARDILVKREIDASRLLAVSFGEERPAIPGASRAERSRNRRVRAEPMRLAELKNYDPDLPPCASTIVARSEPSEAATAEPILAAGTGDPWRPVLGGKSPN